MDQVRTDRRAARPKPSQPMDLYTMMKDFAGSDNPNKTQASQDGSIITIFPTRKVSIPVDVNLVRK